MEITKQVRDLILQISDQNVAEQLDKLLLSIDKRIQVAQQAVNHLPTLHAQIDPIDSSALLEWIFPDFRIGFNIESNPNDSGYHIVANEKRGYKTESGQLKNIDEIIFRLLVFILSDQQES